MKKLFLFAGFALVGLLGQAQDNKVLMTVEDNEVTVSEFLAIYNKNNTSNVVDKKSMEEYLDLFLNFKLKVQAAKELGMDTVPKFINELEGYRRQLAQPYLVDRAMNDQLITEAYERMQTDVAAYHILVKVDENAPAKDTLAALKRLGDLTKNIKSENDMKAALERIRSANDQSTIAEDLGYFTAFAMVYPFETAAYNTEVGTLSKPVRTRFGYHAIFVTDKRPARGEIKASHIMLRSQSDQSPEEQAKVKEKIDELYERLLGGDDFATLAEEYSEDKSSAKNGGKLPWFGTGRMVMAFEDAAFSLQADGDMSAPVQTNYGWHIIQRDEYKGVATFDEVKGSIKKRIERDSRGQQGRIALLNKLKSEYTLGYNYKNKAAVDKLVNADYLLGKWSAVKPEPFLGVLMTITDSKYSNTTKSFTQSDYFDYLLKFQRKYEGSPTLSEVITEQWNGFVNACLIEFENGVLDQKYPEFKALMQEYHDGILLFDLMDERVWSRSVKDSAGLESFFNGNRDKYMWGKRVDASVYLCENAAIEKKTMKMAKKRLKKGYADNAITEVINEGNPLALSIRSGMYAKGDDEYIDNTPWEKGIVAMDGKNGKRVIVQIYNVLEPQPKALAECRGLVTSDYQAFLEEEWMQDLRQKYAFSINKDVFDAINK